MSAVNIVARFDCKCGKVSISGQVTAFAFGTQKAEQQLSMPRPWVDNCDDLSF